MKLTCQILLLVTILGYCQKVSSQTWQHIYFPTKNSYPGAVEEGYDRGFLIIGHYYDGNGFPTFGYILKTDINGNPLWDKHIGASDYGTAIYNIKQTSDGGYIFTGSKTSNDPSGDTFVAKVDPCFDLEWCKLFSSNNNQFDYGKAIFEVPGGYIVLVGFFGDDNVSERIWLFRLNSFGETIWQQFYGQTDPLITNEIGYGLTLNAESKYLITGYCYSPDSGSINPSYLRPILIKVDSIGNVVWELPWAKINGERFLGQAYQSIVDNQDIIYSCGRHIETTGPQQGDKPTMIKTDKFGNEIGYTDLKENAVVGIASTIDWFMDSTIAIGGGWKIQGGIDTQGVFKITKNGNILKTKELFESMWSFQDATVTIDNKLLLVAGLHDDMWNSYAWKLTSDLEYDTIYTQPFTYDSLCPHPIASDTIPLDCVIVGLDEPFQSPEISKLLIYPNPASDKVHIIIPEKLRIESSNPAFTINTVYYQWNSALLEIYNLFGRRIYSKEIPKADKEVELDVSGWAGGNYILRLIYNNQTVCKEQLMVIH